MVIVTDTSSNDAEGNELVFNQSTLFIRGMGGFGGERGSSGEINKPPDREQDAIQDQQALIYR